MFSGCRLMMMFYIFCRWNYWIMEDFLVKLDLAFFEPYRNIDRVYVSMWFKKKSTPFLDFLFVIKKTLLDDEQDTSASRKFQLFFQNALYRLPAFFNRDIYQISPPCIGVFFDGFRQINLPSRQNRIWRFAISN